MKKTMRSATFYPFALVSFVFLVIFNPAYSAIPSQPPGSLQPIDELQESLESNFGSKQLLPLKRAYDLLLQKKYSESIRLAFKFQTDETYSDFGFWIASSSYRALADEKLDHKRYQEALRAALKAFSLSLQIESKSPYSPFLKSLPKDLSEAEFLAGDCYWGMHQWLSAERYYEAALQRLQMQNSLTMADATTVEHYAEACSKKNTPLCNAWMQKLYLALTKASSKGILKFFPTLTDKAKTPHYSNRSSIPYKAPDLDQVLFDSAMKAYLDEKYGDSIKSFQQFLDDFPKSAHRFRARYWLAQAFSRQKEHQKALNVYTQLQNDSPLSYYGFLASNITGKPMETLIDASLPMASAYDPSLSPQEIFHFKRAQQLVAINANALSIFELKELKPRDSLSSPFLVYLAMLNYKAQNYSTGFGIIGELIQRGYEGIVSSFGLRLIFPDRFLDLINKYAAETALDPILVLSLIKQESAFSEDANSSAGAVGLMQLMPMTAFDTDSNVKTPELLRAATNIRIGTKYLKKLMTRYNGNIIFSLAGYNAGPNAVDRWIKDLPQKRSMLEFIETIPYRETREYVASIIRNYYWYSKQLNGGFNKDINYFWNIPIQNDAAPSKGPTNTKIQLKLRNGNA